MAKIKFENVDDFISVKGTATNTLDVIKSLRYSMHVIKANNKTSNTSKSTQEGRFTLLANETKELSGTTINQDEKDKVIVILLIYDDEDVLLGKDRLVLSNNNVPVEAKIPNDGIEILGIVTEDTKTKAGRDFYEFFYSMYNLNQIKGSKIVKISERLSLGRNTIIQISIDNSVVDEFFVKPNQEYLEQRAKLSIRKVFKYFQDIKKQKKYITQY
ncbi:CsgE family curli-type amyloid fiber assembly protein [Snuella lapsa]|uniref:CsgE family curli-type amyloid fiber assembly protein n=1 Tax=Snuella lapsa TaxID=870481 RepID=UPI0031E86465